jgi:alcohol dehydrogenase
MRALILNAERNLQFADVPDPGKPARGEALVRMSWVTINRLDLFSADGMTFAKQKLPMVAGVEGAGVIADVGDGVSGLKPGDRVVLYPGILCGRCRACVRGQENRCTGDPLIRGFNTDGVGSEYIAVAARTLFPVPDNVRLRDAACVPVTAATVEHMLHRNARLGAGETVLIQAGGSGIGSVAIGLAKHLGATVITTVGSDEKIAKARALGADHVINYAKQNFPSTVRRLTDGEGADVVFEHVGTETWEGSLRSLAMGGRLVTCGSHTGTYGRTNLLHLFNRHISIYGSFGGNFADVIEALRRLSAGEIRIPIDTEASWQDVQSGMERLRSRNVFGKVVLKMPGWQANEELPRARDGQALVQAGPGIH